MFFFRIRLLAPLRHRDFAVLMGGSTVSLLGDGFFTVALAFQVYQISNVPSALSLVAVSWTLPFVIFLLAGGIVSDRIDRRHVMIGADLLRTVAIGSVGLLSVGGVLHLWQLVLLMPFYGFGTAFFNPASNALIPDVFAHDDLVQGNAFNGMIRPLMLQLLGPALGGIVVALAGPGPAILFDAGSFLVSAVAVSAITVRPGLLQGATTHAHGMLHEVGEGLRFVRRNAWCGATLLGYSIGLLLTAGPRTVLLPYVVKNQLGNGPEGFGIILAAGGVGAIVASALAGQRGLPRRRVVVMCVVWAVSFAGIACYGAMRAVWQGMAIAFTVNALHGFGLVIWFTLMQTLVPREMLGRVSSLDWLISVGLFPVSLAITGPAVAAIGAGATFLVAGVLGGVGMAAPLLVPALRHQRQAPTDEAVAAR